MTLKYEHLVGLQFDIERQNCYQLLRAFYRDNWDIELTNYACPTNWWANGLNLFADGAESEGFDVISQNPRHWQPGDAILMAINSTRGNHCAVSLGDGRILHHLYGQLSTVTPYSGLFRNTTIGAYRHKLVPPPPEPPQVDLMEHLPPHVRRRLAQQVP